MAKGSMSNQSQNVSRGGSGAAGAVSKASRRAGAPKGRPSKSSAAGAVLGSGQAGGGGILRFYTDDAPGLKIGPVTVLVVSLIYIGCVVLLHIWGKLAR